MRGRPFHGSADDVVRVDHLFGFGEKIHGAALVDGHDEIQFLHALVRTENKRERRWHPFISDGVMAAQCPTILTSQLCSPTAPTKIIRRPIHLGFLWQPSRDKFNNRNQREESENQIDRGGACRRATQHIRASQ